MRTDELRTLLHEHGEQVHDRGASARLDAVRGRVTRTRRRRVALAGGGLVAALAAIALVVVPGLLEPQVVPIAGPDRPGVEERVQGDGADSPISLPPAVVYQGETWVLESSVGTGPGERSLTFRAGLPDQDVLLLEAVEGLPRPASYEVLVDGEYEGGIRLERGDWQVDGFAGSSWEPWAIVDVLNPGTGRDAVLHVVRGRDEHAWLALAQYVRADRAQPLGPQDPRAVTRVAGTEVPTTVEYEGRTWWLGTVHEGLAGKPRWTAMTDRTEVPTLVVAVDGGGGASYVVRSGGDTVATMGNTGVAGPTWFPATVVKPGPGFEIGVEVTGGLTRRTHLAIVEYYPAD